MRKKKNSPYNRAGENEERRENMFAYVGSFNYAGAEGITVCEYDAENGCVTPRKLLSPRTNAGSLTVKDDRLYSTDEQIITCPDGGGGVLCLESDPVSGELTEKSHTFTMASNTSGITFDKTGKYMVVTHFAIGMPTIKVTQGEDGAWHSEKVFPDTITNLYRMNEDGTPGKLCDVLHHSNATAPKPSFIHKAFLAPDGSCFAYGNLGADRIGFFKIDYENEKLVPLFETPCKAGSGPRHLIFHPTLPYLYLNYERNGVVSKFRWSEESCVWEEDVQLPVGDAELGPRDNQSEILINADGRQLYDVLRGLGRLYVMDIDPETGSLRCVQSLETESKAVRGAAFSPDGNYLLLACNDTENVVSYRILENGTLEKAAVSEKITHPAAIAFL